MTKRDKSAPKYRLYLPTEQELIEEIERERAMIVREIQAGYRGGR